MTKIKPFLIHHLSGDSQLRGDSMDYRLFSMKRHWHLGDSGVGVGIFLFLRGQLGWGGEAHVQETREAQEAAEDIQ